MSSKRKHKKASAEVNLGFQIAPMIDVVFVILLYFMVAAGSQQKENAHNTKLPGTVPPEGASEMPDEVTIMIEDDGQVYLNDDPLDSAEAKDLRELAGSLVQLKQASENANSKILVTVYANELAKYERVVDVLDALTRAKIVDVTFQAGAPE
ncbi:biopolymer transporter ExbD [Luteolibacter sp. SL250]|uniref:ExbD/TolR family protein n=1 Tax=Luteolibacter sp. SL250 TaxID=2995170 RepID=UPI00226E735D|nr:biopolymer transporter ExbD [Luteolibacter sp. SL250]WAC19774.1 biopolymer transporter ExbD [Luteolibacter sp. SL250]